MRLFIADDSETIRTYLVTRLSKLDGIEIVGEAEESQEAVEAIERLKPDVVILDIRMPKGDGILTLQTVKRSRSVPIVIMYTNYPYPQYNKLSMVTGADYFYDKATEYRELTETLKKLARQTNQPEQVD